MMQRTLKLMRKNWALYLLILPAFIYFGLFHYAPMYGVQIAFRNFNFVDGITGSEWVGLKWFDRFVSSRQFTRLMGNTLALSVYGLLAGFPFPIIFALMLNCVRSRGYKRVVQTITYMPHFLSTVVIVSMLSMFLSQNSGFINTLIESFGGERRLFMGRDYYFRHVYVWSGIWQSFGWNSIIFFAALTGINPELHEAAVLDGASRWQRILHIDLPGITETMIVLLILNCGSILNVGHEKVFLMQNELNLTTSEVISTYVYKQGLENTKYSFSAAVGLFNSVVNFIILSAVNLIAKKTSGASLW